MAPQKIWFNNSKGQRLAGKLWTPDKYGQTLILSHGIGTTKESWEETDWPSKLVKLGYRVLTFDFSGRGESDGKFIETTLATNIDDLNSAINFTNSDVTLIGQSFGGTTSICVAAENPKVKCLVTRAAAHNMVDWSSGKKFTEAKKKGFSIGSEPWKKYSLEMFKDVDKHKVLAKAKKIKVPWLIIHGDKDTAIPVQHAKDFYTAAKCEKKLAIISGGDHGLSTKDADAHVFVLTKNWLGEHLK